MDVVLHGKPTQQKKAPINLWPFIDCSGQEKKRAEEIAAHKLALSFAGLWKWAWKIVQFSSCRIVEHIEKWTSIKDYNSCNSNRHTVARARVIMRYNSNGTRKLLNTNLPTEWTNYYLSMRWMVLPHLTDEQATLSIRCAWRAHILESKKTKYKRKQSALQ